MYAPCLTGGSNAHGAISKFFNQLTIYSMYSASEGYFCYHFRESTHTGTIISVLHFRLA